MTDVTLASGQIEALRSRLQAIEAWARTKAAPAETLATLEDVDRFLAELSAAPPTGHSGLNTLDYTLEDEDYPPFGRAFQLRLHFRWEDYDPADEPAAEWGARLEHVEILSVEYFDAAGQAQSLSQHHAEVVDRLVEAERERMERECTAHGCRVGVGRAPSLAWLATDGTGATSARMAPSARQRTAQLQRRTG